VQTQDFPNLQFIFVKILLPKLNIVLLYKETSKGGTTRTILASNNFLGAQYSLPLKVHNT